MNLRVIDSASALPWDSLSESTYPFLKRAFLEALEASGSVAKASGWTPKHLCFEDDQGLLACIPSYLKTHSYGEYVFDWAWADAYHRHGLEYYPKLLSAIPFTPCVGPRCIPANNREPELSQLLDRGTEWASEEGLTGWHVLFPEKPTNQPVQWLERVGTQYHWYNQDYTDFDDYLAAMTSRKRKNIKKERQRVVDQGISFRHLEGADISEEDLDIFYVFYQATYAKRGQQGYLSRRFFELVVQGMPDNLFLVMAHCGDRPVAAALFFKDPQCIYGRYWGCLAEYDQLHFETCYYQGLDYAIAQQIPHFDAGAQGEHKIQRGFEPIQTHSWHWIGHPEFRRAIHQFCVEEGRQIEAYMREAAELLPFKQLEPASEGPDSD